MNYSVIQSPNSRYLHLTSAGFSKNWTSLIAKVNAFVGEHAKLSFASHANLLYFFESPDSGQFQESISWVGKEIIGIPQLDPDGDLKSYDLDQGKVLRFRLDINSDLSLLFPEKLENFFNHAILQLSHNGIEPAPTWRLAIFEEIKDGSLKIDVFMDFFSDDR
jgi:hypothetical protein